MDALIWNNLSFESITEEYIETAGNGFPIVPTNANSGRF